MARAARLAALLGVSVLAACGGEAPQPAQFVPPAPAVAELQGPLLARYTLLPTLALDAEVARRYGIERREGTALLLVALRRPEAGDELPAEGEVRAQARDLAGRHQHVAMRRIESGDYVDHVGVVAVGRRDVVRVEVSVEADGRRQQFDFQRSF